MKCPSCLGTLLTATPQCLHCGLTLAQLDARFGAVPRQLAYLTDRTGRMSDRQVERLRLLLGKFHGKFPQALLSVFLSHQLPGPIGEYTFWMANRALLGGAPATGADNFDLLLGIDIDARTAALVIGYGLEHYLDEHDLESGLTAASGPFQAGDFARGIHLCIELLTEKMKSLIAALETPARSAAPPADSP